MSKKRLFYKSIIWQIIGMIWISLLSYLWFGNWTRSLSFTSVVVIVSIFAYILYELARGGRYDGLLKSLGSKKNISAVGAAINLNNLKK